MLKDKKFIYSVIASILLHSAVFIYFAIQKDNPQIPEPPKTVEVTLKGPEQETQFLDQLPSFEASIKCPKSYVGVGFKYRFLSDLITDVAPNSPAERMGLRAGDTILHMTNTDGMSVGGKFSITINRDNTILSFSAKLEDICTK